MDYASRIDNILTDCLFTPDELAAGGMTPEDAVIVTGIVTTFGFHPGRLQSHREEVRALCAEIVPDAFYPDKGGGMTFLNLCVTRDGDQWAEHRNAEALYVLASGLGLAKSLMPRELWGMLPGGVPYIVFDLREGAPHK